MRAPPPPHKKGAAFSPSAEDKGEKETAPDLQSFSKGCLQCSAEELLPLPIFVMMQIQVLKEQDMSLDYNKKNITFAKNLRTNATPQENHLWYDYLSTYKVRFQRQKAIGNFIADFYCHKAKLIIEIDGSQHYTEKGKQNDDFRTEILEGYDLKIIRFTNRQIDTNFQGVCEYIDAAVKASLREGG